MQCWPLVVSEQMQDSPEVSFTPEMDILATRYVRMRDPLLLMNDWRRNMDELLKYDYSEPTLWHAPRDFLESYFDAKLDLTELDLQDMLDSYDSNLPLFVGCGPQDLQVDHRVPHEEMTEDEVSCAFSTCNLKLLDKIDAESYQDITPDSLFFMRNERDVMAVMDEYQDSLDMESLTAPLLVRGYTSALQQLDYLEEVDMHLERQIDALTAVRYLGDFDAVYEFGTREQVDRALHFQHPESVEYVREDNAHILSPFIDNIDLESLSYNECYESMRILYESTGSYITTTYTSMISAYDRGISIHGTHS